MSVAIVTRFLGPTNNRGARIVASVPERIADRDRDQPDNPLHQPSHWRLTIPYPYEAHQGTDAHAVAALALARRLGWTGTWYGGSLADGYAFVTSSDAYKD